MYLKIFEITFLIISFVLTLLLILREFGITKNMDGMKASDFISTIVGFMLAYVINAFVLVVFLPEISSKLIMGGFGISPFVIGKLVTYQKVKFYSIIQILSVIISIGYLLIYLAK